MGQPAYAVNASATLKELIAQNRALRDQIDELNDQVKALEQERHNLDMQIIETMQEQGIDRTGTDEANVSVGVAEFANVEDWDTVYDYIYKHRAFHLLHRRLSAAAAIEIRNLDGDLPGVTFGEKPKLNFRRK